MKNIEKILFLTDLNNLLKASDVVIFESFGIKQKSGNNRNGTRIKVQWSRRIVEKVARNGGKM